MVAQRKDERDDALVVIEGGLTTVSAGSISAAYVEPGREQHTKSVPPDVEGDETYASVLEVRAQGGRVHVSKGHPLDAYFRGE